MSARTSPSSSTTGTLSTRLVAGIDKGWDINRNLFPAEDFIVPDHLQQYLSSWASVYSETVTGEMTYERPINTVQTFDAAAQAAEGRELKTIENLGAYRDDTRNLIVGNAAPEPIQTAAKSRWSQTVTRYQACMVFPLRARAPVSATRSAVCSPRGYRWRAAHAQQHG